MAGCPHEGIQRTSDAKKGTTDLNTRPIIISLYRTSVIASTTYIPEIPAISRKEIIDERRLSPRQDFISDLVNARDAGDKLNDRELFDQIFGICGASLSATSRAAAVRCTCFTRTTTSANN